MLRCREVSKLVSESMERRLPFRQRMELIMHLFLCRLCAGFARQTRLLRRAARQEPERLIGDASSPEVTLTPDARARIKAALRNRGS